MTIDIAKLRALCDAATPGPWVNGEDELAESPDGFYFTWEGRDSDAALIAASRTAVPSLLDEVERLRACVEEIAASAVDDTLTDDEVRAIIARHMGGDEG